MNEKKLVIFDFYGTLADASDQTYPGMEKLVAGLSEKYSLAINSSASSAHLREALGVKGLAECFTDILGFDIFRSKARKIHDLLKKYAIDPKDAVFITDTLGVTWGHHTRERLETGNPYAIVDTVPELEDAIRKFFVIQ